MSYAFKVYFHYLIQKAHGDSIIKYSSIISACVKSNLIITCPYADFNVIMGMLDDNVLA